MSATRSTKWLRRSLKILHEVAGFGVAGGLAACLVVAATADPQSGAAFTSARQSIAAIAKWLLVPSLAVTLVTGMLAIAATKAYHDAGWAWLKALLGIAVFEATLVTVGASDRQATLAALAAAGGDPTELLSMLRSERSTLWLLITLAVANVVLAVWRPRLLPESARSNDNERRTP